MYTEAYSILRKGNFDFFDIYREETGKRQISFKEKDVENIDVSLDGGVGVRGVNGRSTCYIYSQDHSPEEVKKMALSICKQSKISPSKLMYSVKRDSPTTFLPLEDVIGKTKKAMDMAYKISPCITQVKCDYKDTEKQVEIVKSSGKVLKERLTYATFIIEVIARKNEDIQSYRNVISAGDGKKLFEQHDIAGGTMVHEAVGHGLEGDLVYEHLSVYSGKIGEKVASGLITLVDDATLPCAHGSYFFDDEGTDAQRTTLIEKGILKNYITDLMYARLLNVNPSGNGRRQSFRFPPIPRMSNTFILPGKDDPQDIIKSVNNGILVKKMGGGQVNPVTGDFVFEVKEGYRIENGKVGELVRGATVAGNGPQVLNEIDMVGNDLGMEIGTCGKGGQLVPVSDGEPTLRIPSLLIGGS